MTKSTTEPPGADSIWRNGQFRVYLGSTAFSGMGFAMQQLLLSWILIGILELPADKVGLLQALIGIPGVFLMLMGGASADRADPRAMLVWVYLIAPVFPVFLVAMNAVDSLAVWSVVVWGFGISIAQSYSMPAQQAILNEVSGTLVQQGVTAATAVGFVVQVIGLTLAGQIDRIGITPVLLCQAVALLLASYAMSRIYSSTGSRSAPSSMSALQGIVEGFRETVKDRVIFNVLTINFVSSIFNAGSFMTVFPFIVKRIYEGDAVMLSALMALFFLGAALSNALLLRFMPLLRPGKVFLIMQLSRIVVLGLLYLKGDVWLLVIATLGWGLNMGITTNLARMIVQESAKPDFRGRILAVFSVGMVGSAPIGAIVLGALIEYVGVLQALIPAMFVSAALFAYGVIATGVWRYESGGARE